ncbi:oligopeptide transporter 5-like [Musa acuminata AAA Group]|uniref:oligopeptide transporter 5-like n=1 Tax=Musa acuminata AAA Group TaxID=214697 RepID=UPI0031D4D49D
METTDMESVADELASTHPYFYEDVPLVEESPIEQVRLTVPVTDDPTQPCLTFRTWTMGLISCVLLAFVNQFLDYRQNQIVLSSVCVQILTLPVGRAMAATLPTTPIKVPLTNWSFSLNPGPFNLKEHVLITILANAGAGGVYAVNIVTIMKAFYHRNINIVAALLLSVTTQLLGYGWAGLFRKYLVDSPYMWWPGNLVQVSLFRALHEEEKRPKGGVSRFQFFLIVIACSFAYYVVPNFFFPAITSISVVCLIWTKSVTAQQIGSGLHGLGVGSFGLDWSTISGFLGSPLASPAFATFNVLAGFIVLVYVIAPIAYWTNAYSAKNFPMFTSGLFDVHGKKYDLNRVLDPKTFSLNGQEYDSYSDIRLSIMFAISYGLGFATLTATLSHVFFFNGSYILTLWRQTASKAHDHYLDVHGRLMKANYEAVPQWWFHIVLVVVMALAIFTCEGFDKQLQLPYWGVLLAMAMAFVFTLPIGVILATTNMEPGLNVITEMVIGYIMPGKPLANVVFKTYGYISMSQAHTFLADFKLGQYMKIPPKAMFIAQLVGTVVASAVYFGTAWWLLGTVTAICDTNNLPEGSPWTCPNDAVFYSASIIWGVVGPLRMFGPKSIYSSLNYYFLVGMLLPFAVWLLARTFPRKKWIKLINFPVLLGSTSMMPPAHAVNYTSWFVVGIFFNYYVYNKYKSWWGRYVYVLSAGLDAGTAFMAVLAFLTLNNYDIYSVDWWGGVDDDYCPLAKCPTAGSYVPDGCPAIQ